MKALLLTSLLLLSYPAYSAKNYVKGVQRVTFRVGAGTESKIIKMMDADSPVTLLEQGEQWAKVKDSEGNEGYILGRFLSSEIPTSLLYKWLKAKYGKLEKKHQELTNKKSDLKTSLKTKEKELKNITSELIIVQSSLDKLKSDSADYLGLESNFKRTNALLDDQNSKVIALESQLSKHNIFWFLAGAGVLFFGWLVGLQSKKSRHSSQLSF
jgi:SH3 domain protein